MIDRHVIWQTTFRGVQAAVRDTKTIAQCPHNLRMTKVQGWFAGDKKVDGMISSKGSC
jgi:hypothetical protein